MKVFYRICPNPPKKSPIFTDDKFSLVQMCLLSFVNAFRGSTEPLSFVFILDSCPPEYKKTIEKLVPFPKEFIEENEMGNLGSFRKQVDLAAETDDYVLFQEDDYFYLPDTGYKLASAVKNLDFVTPQDELNYYFNEPRHIGKYEIKVIGDHHWREANSTTLTFATHGRLIKENKDIIYKHEIWDYPMWQEIRANGYKVWAPMPTLAAHLVKDLLPPCINWEEEWSKSPY